MPGGPIPQSGDSAIAITIRQRTDCARAIREIAAAEERRQRQAQAVSFLRFRELVFKILLVAGDEITYFSVAQLPRSMMRHRSLQNGISGSSNATGFCKWGTDRFLVIASDIVAPSREGQGDQARESEEMRAAGCDFGMEVERRTTNGLCG